VVLREKHQAYLEVLAQIQQAPEGFDFSGHIAESRRDADELLLGAVGKPAVLLAEASAYRWSVELAERGRAEAFSRELTAFRASPNIYMLDRWLDVWDEVLPGMQKYVLGVDRDRIEIWLNLERGPGAVEDITWGGEGSGSR